MDQNSPKMGLIEITPKSVQEWKRWGAVLMTEAHSEAIQTLEEEGLTQEHVFLINLDDKHHLGYFTEGKGLPANMKREINRKHKDLLERSTATKTVGQLLYSLKKSYNTDGSD